MAEHGWDHDIVIHFVHSHSSTHSSVITDLNTAAVSTSSSLNIRKKNQNNNHQA